MQRKQAGAFDFISKGVSWLVSGTAGAYSALLALGTGAGAAGGYLTAKLTARDRTDGTNAGLNFERAALDSDKAAAELKLYDELAAAKAKEQSRGIRGV